MYVIYNDQIRVIDVSVTAKMLLHAGNTHKSPQLAILSYLANCCQT